MYIHAYMYRRAHMLTCIHLYTLYKHVHMYIHYKQEYSEECVLPKKYGKVSGAWLDQARVHDEYLSSFASTLLTLMPIIHAFFYDCIFPHDPPIMRMHIHCFSLLVSILGFLSYHSEITDALADELADLIRQHHDLYLQCYGTRGIKPKWHHLLHLPGQIRRLGKVISCFAAERKHRSAKRAALHVFRHLEHTTLADMLNQQCEQILDGHNLFKRRFLAHRLDVEAMGQTFARSTEAVLECGHLHSDDVIYCVDGVVARVRCFWQLADDDDAPLVAQCTLCDKLSAILYRDSETVSFIESDSIVDAMTYKPRDDGVIRVILPYIAQY